MENDYSKLLPTLFNGKDLDNLDYVESFYREFGRGDYVGNSSNTTFLGFVEDQEVRLHFVANRITIQFIDGKPSKELMTKIGKWLTEEDNPGLISSVWEESDSEIVAQYYWKEDV